MQLLFIGLAGQIIQTIIDAGYKITALEMFKLEQQDASEFLEVYKEVVNEFAVIIFESNHSLIHNVKDMVDELTSGPCIAMEIVRNKEDNTCTSFREFVGPYDSQIAKILRPNSLRGKFGIDKVNYATPVFRCLLSFNRFKMLYIAKILQRMQYQKWNISLRHFNHKYFNVLYFLQ
jgi:nucleoside diphosphate kinase